MRIVVDPPRGETNIFELESWAPGATVRDLLDALRAHGIRGWLSVSLDGVPLTPLLRLADLALVEGARLSEHPVNAVRPFAGWVLSVAAGSRAGAVVGLAKHRVVTVGSDPGCDLVLECRGVAARHCTLEREADGVRIRHTAEGKETLVDEALVGSEGLLLRSEATITVGQTRLRVRPSLREQRAQLPELERRGAEGVTVAFSRSPVARQEPAQQVLEPPEPPVEREGRTAKPAVLMLVAPIVIAGVFAVMLGDARMMLFAAFGPVTSLLGYLGQAFKARRSRGEVKQQEIDRVAQFFGAVHKAATMHRRGLESLAPDLSVVLRRAMMPSVELWKRRAGEPHFATVRLGVGDVVWRPPLGKMGGRWNDRPSQEAPVLCHRQHALPITVDLGELQSGMLGIVGDRETSVALVRGILAQLAVHCGPADLLTAVVSDPQHERDWSWVSLLPHASRGKHSGQAFWCVSGPEAARTQFAQLCSQQQAESTRVSITIIDTDTLREAGWAGMRQLVALQPGEKVRNIVLVLAESGDALPAQCETTVSIGRDGKAWLRQGTSHSEIEPFTVSGMGGNEALECARSLARLRDPEQQEAAHTIPSQVRLAEVLQGTQPRSHAQKQAVQQVTVTVQRVHELWSTSEGVGAPVGMRAGAIQHIDLVRDGPHALVAGTTGSGKSEFLRTLVISLALHHSPEELNFILVDFKGGAAFADCEQLPHTVGTLSNLDAQLAARAITALEAEIVRRQRLFASAGHTIDTLDAYRATKPAEPMARIVLVVDECAMLAQQLPSVLASFVSIAAVGRTLGIHLVLATQRPAGVVTEDILANTNLRVALRVQSPEDSLQVIESSAAANLSRHQTGRALLRLGRGEVVEVQTAMVRGKATREVCETVSVSEADPFRPVSSERATIKNRTEQQRSAVEQGTKKPGSADGAQHTISVIALAAERLGLGRPRRVWPEPLPGQLCREQLDLAASTENSVEAPLVVALADDPPRQRQYAGGWHMTEGNLLLLGLPGSGTSNALVQLAMASLHRSRQSPCQLLFLEMGRGTFDAFDASHATRTLVASGPDAAEQRSRLIRFLHRELQARQASNREHEPMLIYVDGFTELREEYQDHDGQMLLDMFMRVYADGPSVAMHTAMSAHRAASVPAAIDALTKQRWVFRLANVHDYAALGIRPADMPADTPGRCIDTASGHHLQVVKPSKNIEVTVRALNEGRRGQRPPDPAAVMPGEVMAASLERIFRLSGESIELPVGIDEETLAAFVARLKPGQHVLVAGPSRSGKTTFLGALREMCERALAVFVVCSHSSPLRDMGDARVAVTTEAISGLVRFLRSQSTPSLLLIDDADEIDDECGELEQLLRQTPVGLTIIAAGHSSRLRQRYGHWSAGVRDSRCGLLLQPDADYDGELLGVRLPRSPPIAMTEGRGYWCEQGQATLVQSMRSGTP